MLITIIEPYGCVNKAEKRGVEPQSGRVLDHPTALLRESEKQ